MWCGVCVEVEVEGTGRGVGRRRTRGVKPEYSFGAEVGLELPAFVLVAVGPELSFVLEDEAVANRDVLSLGMVIARGLCTR
jgi:hypothetical protein